MFAKVGDRSISYVRYFKKKSLCKEGFISPIQPTAHAKNPTNFHPFLYEQILN